MIAAGSLLIICFCTEMENTLFPFSSFNFNEIQGDYAPLKGHDREEVITKGKQDPLFEIHNFCSRYGFYQEKMAQKDHQQPIPDYWTPNDFHSNGGKIISELGKEKEGKPYPYSVASLELLSSKFKLKLSREGNSSNQTNGSGLKLSTEEIVRQAGERYIRLFADNVSMFTHPYGSALSGLSTSEVEDVELIQLLLAAAEKVGYQQFDDRASRLLAQCEWTASDAGNPVQRLVFCFAKALQERIDRETGRMMDQERGRNEKSTLVLGSDLAFLKYHQEIPFTQVAQFVGVQAIIENVAVATKVHLIDLQIRSGVQWTILMQALAERYKYPIRLLKITAVGTTDKQEIEKTGKRLVSFAESLNLPLLFKLVFLPDMKDLKPELFDVEADEEVAVYSLTILRAMISRPHCLENLMRVIRRLNPSIMAVTEVEANHNSPSFMHRFIEALFFHTAFFDCFEDCMERDNQCRMVLEGIYLRDGIQNMVATEGEERITRSVKIDVWRAFFARFGMLEIELSESSLYQAGLVVKRFACASSCTLDNNGKCLIVGWKGTPIHSISTWKFS